MKRGFLNTEKAKRKLAETDIPRANDNVPDKGKGKAKAETFADPGIKADLPRLDLHSAPQSINTLVDYQNSRNRFVFRHWPRDPHGKIILPSDIRGKEAGNGLNLWGATLYDFFFVHRIPDDRDAEYGLTISTGSRLTKIMQAFNELEYAKDELAWAAGEADPTEIQARDPAKDIVAHERRVHAGAGVVDKVTDKTSTQPKVSGLDPDVEMRNVSDPVASQAIEQGKEAVEAAKDQGEPSGGSTNSRHKMGEQYLLPHIPLESPFHPSHYPPPWPLIPFESPYPPSSLERGIPIHLLPKKLYVHDPWKLVHIDLDEDHWGQEKESWTSKREHVHTYTLELPPNIRKAADAAAKTNAEVEKESILILPQKKEGPTTQPAIRVIFPERPSRPTEVPEAHLYLSPKCKLGTGHHSIVYVAELELPRDLFCQPTYCNSCIDEQIKAEIDGYKASGVWQRALDEAFEKSKAAGKVNAALFDSPSSSSAQIPLRYVGYVKVRTERMPMEMVHMVTVTEPGETPPVDAPSHRYACTSDPATQVHFDYQGLILPICPNIQWQDPSLPHTLCVHNAQKIDMKPVPRTARFRVAAKLSYPHDPHLAREAHNYLDFPPHFFQHWNGYNVVPPLHDPTPVCALVPQFFGYYTPDSSQSPTPPDSSQLGSGDKEKGKEKSTSYQSPILLLEHCGNPIRISELSIDDRHECAALLFRFHAAGWLHESFAKRNILMRSLPSTLRPPLVEKEDVGYRYRQYGFRLIDFGRSIRYDNPASRATEESLGRNLFELPF